MSKYAFRPGDKSLIEILIGKCSSARPASSCNLVKDFFGNGIVCMPVFSGCCEDSSMLSKDEDTKVIWICPSCGSSNIVIDAWAVWDVDTQRTVLGNTFDH